MDKHNLFDKLKEGVSVHELEGFARKHTTEVFSILAIIIGTISSSFDFFTGPKTTLFFLALSAIISVMFPVPVEKGLRQVYSFTFKQEKMTEIVLGSVRIVIALFVPFVYFSLIGLLAGTSYHYYLKRSQIISNNKPHDSHKSFSGDEHD